ncbi:MAG TPA: hypothetical protein VNL77_23805, partial [Roseiflexaceae bacterium]|nr:hypothetical protein [Roseiflexaceae bacterium]
MSTDGERRSGAARLRAAAAISSRCAVPAAEERSGRTTRRRGHLQPVRRARSGGAERPDYAPPR